MLPALLELLDSNGPIQLRVVLHVHLSLEVKNKGVIARSFIVRAVVNLQRQVQMAEARFYPDSKRVKISRLFEFQIIRNNKVEVLLLNRQNINSMEFALIGYDILFFDVIVASLVVVHFLHCLHLIAINIVPELKS